MGKQHRRKKKSDAWKELVRVHRRGPKRVKTHRPRRKNGEHPLSDPKKARRIQVVLKSPFGSNKLGICLFQSVFEQLGLVEGETYTMPRDAPTRPAVLLHKAIDTFGHNDFMLGNRMREIKLDNIVGRCIVLTGPVRDPNATFIIVKN